MKRAACLTFIVIIAVVYFVGCVSAIVTRFEGRSNLAQP